MFLDFHLEIRKIIYTTNIIENLNGKIRKYTKNKLSYPTMKPSSNLYSWQSWRLQKKCTMTIRDCGMILNQFMIFFDNRLKL